MSGGYRSGDEAVARQHTDDVVFLTRIHRLIRALASALRHRGRLLMLQKNPKREAVRDEQQRHDQRGNEVGRAQLPWPFSTVVLRTSSFAGAVSK